MWKVVHLIPVSLFSLCTYHLSYSAYVDLAYLLNSVWHTGPCEHRHLCVQVFLTLKLVSRTHRKTNRDFCHFFTKVRGMCAFAEVKNYYVRLCNMLFSLWTSEISRMNIEIWRKVGNILKETHHLYIPSKNITEDAYTYMCSTFLKPSSIFCW